MKEHKQKGMQKSENKKRPSKGASFVWSGKRDLNPRHLPWQGNALPLSYSRISAVLQRPFQVFLLYHILHGKASVFKAIFIFFRKKQKILRLPIDKADDLFYNKKNPSAREANHVLFLCLVVAQIAAFAKTGMFCGCFLSRRKAYRKNDTSIIRTRRYVL